MEYLDVGGKEIEGKFLKRVMPKDLDKNGRFVCKEPVLVIGSHAFDLVRGKLTYVKIDGVISIEDEAFAGCVNLKKADINFELDYDFPACYDAHMYWKNKVIKNEDDYYVTLDDYIQKGDYSVHIKDGAFNDCVDLKSFRFPSRVVLHGSPFRHCYKLTELFFDGPFRLDIEPEIMSKFKSPNLLFRKVTFKDCNYVEKMNFSKFDEIDIDAIAPFENLKEVNLDWSFMEKRKFWKEAISRYPQFFLKLPTSLYQDKNFQKICLKSVPDVLEAVYGYPACQKIFENLIDKKLEIEKNKMKSRAKMLKKQKHKRQTRGGDSRTR